MSESHCPVVRMVGVQDTLVRYPRSIAMSSCASRSIGEVASSSGGQQAREQKRSAGRQLGGVDDDFDYYASLRRCSLCVRVSGLFRCRVFCCRVRVRVTC